MEEGQDKWKQKLTQNFVYLLRNMDCSIFLLAHLIEAKVLDEWKKDEIHIIQVRHDRNDALIWYLKTRSEEDYYRFLRALIETNQQNTVKRLEGDAILQRRLNPLYPQNSSTPFLDSNEENAGARMAEPLSEQEAATPDDLSILQSSTDETVEMPHHEENADAPIAEHLDEQEAAKSDDHRILQCSTDETVEIPHREASASSIRRRKNLFTMVKKFLKIGSLPKIKAISPADIVTTPGETVHIKANVTGKPEPKIVWSKDGHDVVYSKHIVLVRKEEFIELTVPKVAGTQSGIYRLEARNDMGIDGATFTLTVIKGYSPEEEARRLEIEKIGLKFEENTKAAAIAFKKSLGLRSSNSIVVTGGIHAGIMKSDVFLLEQESNNSMKCIPLPQFALKTARHGHESALINGSIVTFGGRDQNDHRLSSAECIDLNAMTTKIIASMITPRDGFSCGVIGDKVFACGGWNNQSKRLDLCEYYDIVNDKWITFSSTKYKRYNSSGDVLNGILYVTGGYGEMVYRSVEAYDPVVDKWSSCPSLKNGRYGHGCAILQGAIYVAGGWRCVPECERYDPRMSEWVECANMKQGRHGHVLVGADDQLYAIGGNKSGNLAFVETYDPRNNKWQIMENVIEPLYCMSAVVL